MIKHRIFFLIALCSFPIYFLFAQDLNIKELSNRDLFRGDIISEEMKSARNRTWEEVSLSLLVQEVEAEAEAAGLQSFSLNISNNAINIIYRDIRFLPDSSEVRPETIEKIKKLTGVLKRFTQMDLLVQGHTAKLSPEDTDDGVELSKERAESVSEIITKTGIFKSEQIEAVGKGFHEPVADNSTPEGRALNRRVEISIVRSVGQDSDTGMVWWNFLSKAMNPGYTAYLVHYDKLDEVKATLEAEGIDGLIFAETSAGIGIIDNSIICQEDGSPDVKSVERMQKTGSLLSLVDTEVDVRIGGYGSDLPVESIEECHFLTAYTLGTIAGFNPDNIIFGSAPYILAKASTELTAGKIITTNGQPIEIEGSGSSFKTVVPFAVDSLIIDLTPADPDAVVIGLPEGPVAIIPGDNEISVSIESETGTQKISSTYNLSVTREKTKLQNLSISAGDTLLPLSPAFSSDIKTYQTNVSVETTDVEVIPLVLAEDELAGAEVSIKKEYELQVGENTIDVILSDGYSEDEVYTIKVIRPAPAATTLAKASITATDGNDIEITPEFGPEITTYTAVVPYSVESISINLTPTDDEAILDTKTAEVPLSVGDNELTTIITDQIGRASTEYKLVVKREAPAVTTLSKAAIYTSNGDSIEIAPKLTPDTRAYKAVVPYSVDSVSINLTPTDDEAILNTRDAEVPLSVGENELTTIITDQLGGSPTEYKLLIERSAPVLSGLKINHAEDNKENTLVPDFDPEVTKYSITVPYKVSKLQLDAILSDNDIAAGARVEVLSDNEEELPVGTSEMVVRVTDADGNSYDYLVEVSREENKDLIFDFGEIGLIPEWFAIPSFSIYTGGVGFKLNGGKTVRFTEDSDVNEYLLPLRIGVGIHFHVGAGNYLMILSGGAYLSGEYIFQTESFLPEAWYLPKTIIPRLETGFTYDSIDYTDGRFYEGPAFYLSPAVRTDFVLPFLPEMTFGLDISYTAYISSLPITYLSLGINVGW